MRERRSPYTVLGLRPGADRAAIDDAYRRLIKQHHPDRPGGDPAAAAELNRAYARLKTEAPLFSSAAPLAAPVLPRGARRRLRGRLAGMLMVLAAGAAVWLAPWPDLRVHEGVEPAPLVPAHDVSAELLPETLDLRSRPDEDAIVSAVGTARRLSAPALQGEAVRFSRSCEQDLKSYASPALLDHCVAFDAASGLLGGAAPDARFRAEDMAARHVGAAMRVSDDPVLAEERIVRVRRRVEQLLLNPRLDQGAPTGTEAAGATGLAVAGPGD